MKKEDDLIERMAEAGYTKSMADLAAMGFPTLTWETENEVCKNDWREMTKVMLSAQRKRKASV